ncbi:hypothetical protein H4582DRAFT_2131191 [Lactarius indigo]|nr:hypothetical protein H4582DRAFT_2131191 [Lactarius indigo]
MANMPWAFVRCRSHISKGISQSDHSFAYSPHYIYRMAIDIHQTIWLHAIGEGTVTDDGERGCGGSSVIATLLARFTGVESSMSLSLRKAALEVPSHSAAVLGSHGEVGCEGAPPEVGDVGIEGWGSCQGGEDTNSGESE